MSTSVVRTTRIRISTPSSSRSGSSTTCSRLRVAAMADEPHTENTPAGDAPDTRRQGEERRQLIDLVRAERGEPERRDLGTARRDGDPAFDDSDEAEGDEW